jgi:predicted nucleic acid-binding protein
MKLLVDTNVFLEILLSDSRSDEAREFLENSNGHELFVSDFALHSIGLLLLRRSLPEVFVQFLEDTIDAIGVKMVSLTEQELRTVVSNASAFDFDFDDAYQYSVAEKYDFTLISFDTDFDRSKRGRKSPADVS